MRATTWLALFAALSVWTQGSAHHSFAMYDLSRTVTLHGRVRTFQWTNPHCVIELLVPAHGTSQLWRIETAAPNVSYRRGFRPGSFKAGDVVTVVINPLKDGTRGGDFVSAIDVRGRTLTTVVP
jgi:hypothetical protein